MEVEDSRPLLYFVEGHVARRLVTLLVLLPEHEVLPWGWGAGGRREVEGGGAGGTYNGLDPRVGPEVSVEHLTLELLGVLGWRWCRWWRRWGLWKWRRWRRWWWGAPVY